MENQKELEFLGKSLYEFSFSDEFIHQAQSMNFHTMQDLYDAGWAKIFKKKNFSYSWFAILAKELEENNMLHIIHNKKR